MRAEYIINLINAHCKEDEQKFSQIVQEIYEMEEKKGNTSIARKIKESYNKKSINQKGKSEFSPSSGLVMFEPSRVVSPKEKNSSYNLFDLIYPEDIDIPNIILSDQITNKLEEVIFEFFNKDKLNDMNLPYDNRILLCGPPGCGKTSTAYLLSKRLNMPIAYVRLDSLISSLLGQTGTNIRRIFEAVNGKEVILFLDEFDAIAKKRDDKNELGELKRVVNTLLQNIDMLPKDMFVIAATNHEELLDSAVWRRFDSVINIGLPDSMMRERYLKSNLSNYELNINIDWDRLIRLTRGLSFSQLNDVVVKTIKKALIFNNNSKVNTSDFIEAIKHMTFLYNDNPSSIDTKLIKNLKNSGLTIRDISDLSDIPKSTISDRLKESDKNE
ncbi:ATP-binding protein [Heyndrickxia oleronia]|uniref:AAA family ATPase n=1 Tax=Heyndrickxia oleronia TaxID=38875 RepID=UPI0020412F19|nr:ATP-binding protein [Heyndrickxia oleronia]MCM3239105.1 ATP-binding protein [Heyndrickxia oleronia]